jgi:AAA+ ATPase superfamily predicted ATPase
LKGEVIDTIYNLTNGIPFYLQFIGRGLLREKSRRITPEIINNIFNDLLKEEANLLFNEEFYSLSAKEREILFYMAKDSLNRPIDISNATNDSLNVISRYLRIFDK